MVCRETFETGRVGHDRLTSFLMACLDGWHGGSNIVQIVGYFRLVT